MMDESEYSSVFNELVERIRQLPPDQRARLEELATETQKRHEETRDAVDRAQTALQKLNLTLQLALIRP